MCSSHLSLTIFGGFFSLQSFCSWKESPINRNRPARRRREDTVKGAEESGRGEEEAE